VQGALARRSAGLAVRLVRYLNWVLTLANLLPALPFDGGRMLRAFLNSTSVVSSRDNPYAFYAAGPSS